MRIANETNSNCLLCKYEEYKKNEGRCEICVLNFYWENPYDLNHLDKYFMFEPKNF